MEEMEGILHGEQAEVWEPFITPLSFQPREDSGEVAVVATATPHTVQARYGRGATRNPVASAAVEAAPVTKDTVETGVSPDPVVLVLERAEDPQM